MMRGIYKKRLLKVFMVIALILTMISSILVTSVLYFINSDSYKRGISNFAYSRAEATKLALGLIEDAHNATKNSKLIKNWGESEFESANYYFYSVKIYKEISKRSSYVKNLDYENAITKTDDDSFVISQNGTISKSSFINNQLSKECWNEILNSAATSNIIPLHVANKLDKLIYYSKENNDLLILTIIPLSSLVKENEHWALYLNNKIHSNDSRLKYDEMKNLLISQTAHISEFKADRKYIYIVASDIMNFKLMFFYPLVSDNFISLIIYSVLLFILMLSISFLLAFLLAKKLYEPIGQTVKIIENTEKDTKLDEFRLLSENLDSLSELKKRLAQLSDENSRYFLKRYFGELLYSPHPLSKSPLTEDESQRSYAVALIDFLIEDTKNEDEYYLQLQRTIVMMQLRSFMEKQDLYYLNLSYTRFVLIINCDKIEQAEELLYSFYQNPDIDIDLTIALSDVKKGTEEICRSFKQVKKIIEYRHLFDKYKVLTPNCIPQNDSNYFYYPIYIESRIVSSVTGGNAEKALKIFDSVIDENFNSMILTKEAHQNLIYSLIGTLLRIIQELKAVPMELIGRNFDFSWLYSNWANSKIIPRLRTNIKEIAIAVNEKNKLSKSDEYLLDKMRDFIFNNYFDDIMLVDISEYCNITPKYCSTLFKRLSRENFKTFLNQYRIERACEKIRENPEIKISDLATSVGFNSSNTFIRVFKSFQNITPKAYAEEIINLIK